jgi:aldehyde dehydrogenase (NAD+)
MSSSLITGDLAQRRALYVGGRWTPGGGALLHTVSPVTEAPNGVCVTACRADIDAAVTAARRAVDTSDWPLTDVSTRGDWLARLRRVYTDHRWVMHQLVCAQTGALASHTAQVTDPLEIMRLAADDAAGHGLGVRHNSDGGPRPPFVVHREPVGVVVAVTGWDMPQKALAAKLAPALLAGCAVIVVPSPRTPLDALYLADLAHTVRLPPGVLSVLPILGNDPTLLQYLVTHPGVDKVTFSGSAATGARIAGWCAPILRPVQVHTGCRSAAIVADDADLADAVASLRSLALGDCAQLRCTVGRVVVHQAVANDLADRLRAMMRGLQVGDPGLAQTEVGPMVSAVHRHRLLELVRVAHRRGLRVLTGMGEPAGPGFYVHPALLADVPPGALPEQDTLLGPVLTMHTFRDDTHAVELANRPAAGLAAAVYSADQGRAQVLASRLRAATVHINGAQGEIRRAQGPLRHGGFGRELCPEDPAGFAHVKVVVG